MSEGLTLHFNSKSSGSAFFAISVLRSLFTSAVSRAKAYPTMLPLAFWAGTSWSTLNNGCSFFSFSISAASFCAVSLTFLPTNLAFREASVAVLSATVCSSVAAFSSTAVVSFAVALTSFVSNEVR